jgi:hypothetical protein
MPRSPLLHHPSEPANHPQKPFPVLFFPTDDFVWPSECIDSRDILDLVDMDDYYLPDRRLPTDA